MRRSFTKSELALARRFAVAYRRHYKLAKRHKFGHFMHRTEIALEGAAKELHIRGRVDNGEFRTAFITKDFVFKVQRKADKDSKLSAEARFIAKMKQSRILARHFPLTVMIGHTMMMQERVRNVDSKTLYRYNEDVGELADFLGIDDAHSQNFGWAGPKGREWPVFIDMDFRLGSKRGRKKRQRSWMKFAGKKLRRAA